MPFSSVINIEKPMPHISLADWNNRVNALKNTSEARREEAFAIRQASRSLRYETRIEGDWTLKETNETLEDRISELERWREIISRTFERIVHEMKLLDEEKASTERELDAMQNPLAVVSECLTSRDCRLGSEITYDDADTELKKELYILENNQQILIDQCHKTWEKMCRLEDVKFQIGLEIGNKLEAEDLDRKQIALDQFSANISYKPNPMRNPKNSCAYKAWLEHTKNMKELAENELADTYTIRESLFVCREKARNMLQSQMDRTEHTIRKRIFETQRARNELQWQQLRNREDMEAAVCEIKALEQALRDKTDAFKLAQTRLENRAQRSGMELCLDPAHDQLVREVQKLQNIRDELTNQIEQSKANYNLLEAQSRKVEVDLGNKEHSLMTDIRALDLRARLKGGEFGRKVSPTQQTERNIVLSKMESEIPKN